MSLIYECVATWLCRYVIKRKEWPPDQVSNVKNQQQEKTSSKNKSITSFFQEGCRWCWAPVMHATCITASCPGLWPDCVYHYPIILNGVCKLNIYSPSTICHAKVFSKCPPEAGSATTSVRKTWWDLEWEAENNVERNKHSWIFMICHPSNFQIKKEGGRVWKSLNAKK